MRLLAVIAFFAALPPIAGFMDEPDLAVPVSVVDESPPAPTARPRPTERRDVGRRFIFRHGRLAGKASWHATGRDGYFAAACQPLRRAIGHSWRGRHVLVAYGRKAVELTLNDWCASRDKAIDLSDEMFFYLSGGHLSRGVLRVTVEW